MKSESTLSRGPLQAADLYSLEEYARCRGEFRARVLAHKRDRTAAVGPNMTWIFEDRLTIQYQVQEMLRIERIFEPAGIREELETYNPLIPDGSNLKATLLIEFPEPAERQLALARMKGVERRCYMQVAGFERVLAIADEDLERENEAKTSAVHWIRFEFTPAMRTAMKSGTPVTIGSDHPAYDHSLNLSSTTAVALARDFG